MFERLPEEAQETSNGQMEASSGPERKENIFIRQAEEANVRIDDLTREYRAARAEMERIENLMYQMKYPGKINDLGDAREKVAELKRRLERHPDNKVSRMDYGIDVQEPADFNLHGNEDRVFRKNNGSLNQTR